MMDLTNAAARALKQPISTSIVLSVLFASYTLNYLDRSVIAFLAIPMKADLGLSDIQFGFLSGPMFSTIYGLCSFIVAYIADRRDRFVVLAILLGVWSAATIACALADSFWQLVAARMIVAMGEAGGAPIALALVATYCNGPRLSSAYSVFMIAPPAAILLSGLAGGFGSEYLGWRGAFVACGVPGLALAFFTWYFLRDPRPSSSGTAQVRLAGLIAETWHVILRIWRVRSALGVWASFSLAIFFTSGMINWGPILLNRQFNVNPSDASVMFALALVAGIVPGLLIGGALADRLASRELRWLIYLPMLAITIATPILVIGATAGNVWFALGAICLGTFAGQLGTGVSLGTFNRLMPPDVRSLAGACILFGAAVIGNGTGTAAVGLISQMLTPSLGIRSLGTAIAIVVSVFGGVASVMLARARNSIITDLVSTEA